MMWRKVRIRVWCSDIHFSCFFQCFVDSFSYLCNRIIAWYGTVTSLLLETQQARDRLTSEKGLMHRSNRPIENRRPSSDRWSTTCSTNASVILVRTRSLWTLPSSPQPSISRKWSGRWKGWHRDLFLPHLWATYGAVWTNHGSSGGKKWRKKIITSQALDRAHDCW